MTEDDSNKQNTQDPEKSREMLKHYMEQARANLSGFLDTQGLHLSALGAAMDRFVSSTLPLPEGAACKTGCAYCCHLRVGVSIPEALIIFNELKSQATPEGFAFLKQKVIQSEQKGNTLEEAFWLSTQTPCPFLDIKGKKTCLIYALRPFSCRAYHSTDLAACRTGFEMGHEQQIPCFPLYRAVTDMYTSVFIQVMAQKGLFSFQVGFVRALQILFEDDTAADHWIQGNDVFRSARLS